MHRSLARLNQLYNSKDFLKELHEVKIINSDNSWHQLTEKFKKLVLQKDMPIRSRMFAMDIISKSSYRNGPVFQWILSQTASESFRFSEGSMIFNAAARMNVKDDSFTDNLLNEFRNIEYTDISLRDVLNVIDACSKLNIPLDDSTMSSVTDYIYLQQLNMSPKQLSHICTIMGKLNFPAVNTIHFWKFVHSAITARPQDFLLTQIVGVLSAYTKVLSNQQLLSTSPSCRVPELENLLLKELFNLAPSNLESGRQTLAVLHALSTLCPTLSGEVQSLAKRKVKQGLKLKNDHLNSEIIVENEKFARLALAAVLKKLNVALQHQQHVLVHHNSFDDTQKLRKMPSNELNSQHVYDFPQLCQIVFCVARSLPPRLPLCELNNPFSIHTKFATNEKEKNANEDDLAAHIHDLATLNLCSASNLLTHSRVGPSTSLKEVSSLLQALKLCPSALSFISTNMLKRIDEIAAQMIRRSSKFDVDGSKALASCAVAVRSQVLERIKSAGSLEKTVLSGMARVDEISIVDFQALVAACNQLSEEAGREEIWRAGILNVLRGVGKHLDARKRQVLLRRMKQRASNSTTGLQSGSSAGRFLNEKEQSIVALTVSSIVNKVLSSRETQNERKKIDVDSLENQIVSNEIILNECLKFMEKYMFNMAWNFNEIHLEQKNYSQFPAVLSCIQTLSNILYFNHSTFNDSKSLESTMLLHDKKYLLRTVQQLLLRLPKSISWSFLSDRELLDALIAFHTLQPLLKELEPEYEGMLKKHYDDAVRRTLFNRLVAVAGYIRNEKNGFEDDFVLNFKDERTQVFPWFDTDVLKCLCAITYEGTNRNIDFTSTSVHDDSYLIKLALEGESSWDKKWIGSSEVDSNESKSIKLNEVSAQRIVDQVISCLSHVSCTSIQKEIIEFNNSSNNGDRYSLAISILDSISNLDTSMSQVLNSNRMASESGNQTLWLMSLDHNALKDYLHSMFVLLSQPSTRAYSEKKSKSVALLLLLDVFLKQAIEQVSFTKFANTNQGLINENQNVKLGDLSHSIICFVVKMLSLSHEENISSNHITWEDNETTKIHFLMNSIKTSLQLIQKSITNQDLIPKPTIESKANLEPTSNSTVVLPQHRKNIKKKMMQRHAMVSNGILNSNLKVNTNIIDSNDMIFSSSASDKCLNLLDESLLALKNLKRE